MKNIAVCDRFIGRKPGRCYSMGVSHPEAFAAGTNLVLNSAEAPFTALTVYGHSTQDGTPTPENPVPIVSAGDNGEINVSVSDGGTQSQTLTLSTPGGLPGIPVTSGGNYTDESGQQWICDEIDYKRGKYVQRVKSARLSGNIYDTEISLGRYIINISNIFGSIPNVRYPVITSVASTIEPITQSIQNQIFQYGDGIYWYCTDYISSKEELQTFLEENDVTIIGHLAEPIETPLSASDIAAYAALRTYSPTTVVSNDADAWMKVGYYGLSAIQKLEKEALLINGGKSK